MKLKILAGPTFLELSHGADNLAKGNQPVFVFRVRPIRGRMVIPNITIQFSEIFPLEVDARDRIGFKMKGLAKEGDRCRLAYYPFERKRKGAIRLTN